MTAPSDVIGIDERVRREDRSRGQHCICAAEDLLLHRTVLDDGFDHQISHDELVDGLDARKHPARVGTALLRELRERALDRREAPLDGAGCGVEERNAPPGRRDDLRDAAAHLACAHDEDLLERSSRRRLWLWFTQRK